MVDTNNRGDECENQIHSISRLCNIQSRCGFQKRGEQEESRLGQASMRAWK